MPFTNQERINSYSQILQALTVGGPRQSWYETQLFYESAIVSDQVLDSADIKTLRQYPASSLTQARTNAAMIPNIVSDLSQFSSAVRLTPVPGTNGTVYVALSVYGDFSSQRLNLWLQPQMIPQLSGLPSNGYAVRLFNGNPSLGGTEISTTQGTGGTGINKSVAWIPISSAGILLLAEDFASQVTDPYFLGFRYIGRKAAVGQRNEWFQNTNLITVLEVSDISEVQVWTSEEQQFTFDSMMFNQSPADVNSGDLFSRYENWSSMVYDRLLKTLTLALNDVKSGYAVIR